jgi:hypothetical protein
MIPKHLPFSGANNAIVKFRHALALDEHRVKFLPFFCTVKPKMDSTNTKVSDPGHSVSEHSHHKPARREVSEESVFEDGQNILTGPDTDVQEVFFSGAHCGTAPSPSIFTIFPHSPFLLKILAADP